jgi:hypothetical protein
MLSSSLLYCSFHFFVSLLANKRAVAAPYLYFFNHMQQHLLNFSIYSGQPLLIQSLYKIRGKNHKKRKREDHKSKKKLHYYNHNKTPLTTTKSQKLSPPQNRNSNNNTDSKSEIDRKKVESMFCFPKFKT